MIKTVAIGALALSFQNSVPVEPQDDVFSRVVAAVSHAVAADGRHQKTARQQAADFLALSGAHPLQDTPDLASSWNSRPRTAAALPVYRNRLLGPGYKQVTLASGALFRIEQTFLAGQHAQVAVVASTQTPFSLVVTDDEGQAVCQPNRRLGRCDWFPMATVRFSISLANRGARPASYFVIMQ